LRSVVLDQLGSILLAEEYSLVSATSLTLMGVKTTSWKPFRAGGTSQYFNKH